MASFGAAGHQLTLCCHEHKNSVHFCTHAVRLAHISASFTTANGTLTQGEQQSFATVSILNLRAHIQGFYRGGNLMNAVLDPATRPLECDTLTLKLAAAAAPYAIQYTDTAVLSTAGDAVFRFPETVQGFSVGYVLYDLTGDRMTDASDYSLLENNAVPGKSVLRPW